MILALDNYFIPVQTKYCSCHVLQVSLHIFWFLMHRIERTWEKKKTDLITRCGCEWTGSWSSLCSGRRWHGWRRQPGLCLHIHRWVWHCGMLLSAICNTHHRNIPVYFPKQSPLTKIWKRMQEVRYFSTCCKITPDYLFQCTLPKLHYLNHT